MRDCLRGGFSGLLLMLAFVNCGDPTPALPEYVEVPINLSGAKGLGTLHVELAYDPTVLQAVGIELGELAAFSFQERDLKTPGKVIVDLVSSGGIDAEEGTKLVEVTFKILDSLGSSSLVLQEVAARNFDTLTDMPADIVNGNFAGLNQTLVPPEIHLNDTPDLVVPINLIGAKRLGALHVELAYDQKVLQAIAVEMGELAGKSFPITDLETPGKVIVGIVDPAGIDAIESDVIVEVTFRILDGLGSSSLELEEVAAHNFDTLNDMPLDIINGSFDGSSQTLVAPEIKFLELD